MSGKFISFEGLDGCGKSTQIQRLTARLRGRGEAVVVTREPGGTALGERLRALVLSDAPGGDAAALAPGAELALMCASRAQSVAEVIRPALARGEWVLCDRFHDATEAYQGGGRRLDRDGIRALHSILCGGLQPDLTLILNLDVTVSLARARRRIAGGGGEGRFEREEIAFFERVAKTYDEIAVRDAARCRRVDASGTPGEVEQRVAAAVEPLFSASTDPKGEGQPCR